MIKSILLPLPIEGSPTAGLDIVTASVYTLLHSRMELSEANSNKVAGAFADDFMQAVYCVMTYDEIAALLGISARTAQRSVQRLVDARMIVRWRGATYNPAMRYNLPTGVLQAYRDGRDWQRIRARWRHYWDEIATDDQRDRLR